MADEGGMQNFHSSKDSDDYAISSKSILFKIGEVILALIIIGLIIYPLSSFYDLFTHSPKLSLFDVAFIYITLIGYIIINGILIISYFLGDRMPRLTVLLYTIVGTLLHLVTAILMVTNWSKMNGSQAYRFNNHTYGSKLYLDMLISAAVLTFLETAAYAVDVFFTIRFF